MEKTQTPEQRLNQLATELMTAKKMENVAKAERVCLEAELASLIECSETASKTITTCSGLKVTVTRGFNFKTDFQGMKEAMIGQLIGAPIKSSTKHELDLKGYKWFEENNPEMYAAISKFVVATPKKTSVSVK